MAFLKKRGNTWYLYWTVNGKKRGKSLKTRSKTTAQAYLNEFEYRLAKKQLGQATDITLDRLRDEYLEYAKTTKKEKTIERHDTPRTKRFVDYLKGRGVTKASQITQTHAEDYQKHLAEQFASATVRHCMFAASGLLSFAVRRQYVTHNIVKNVEKIKAPKNPPRYLSFEEWAVVERVAKKTYLWPLVATAYYAGFRNSELRFLTWAEIDFDRSVITLTNKKGFTLKSRESRTVPLNQELANILQPRRKKSGWCFMDQSGKQFDRDSKLSREFKRLIVKPSGLAHFSLHTLRHTFASHLVMKGVSIYKVSQWLGHSSVNTTMIYAHLAPQDDEINKL